MIHLLKIVLKICIVLVIVISLCIAFAVLTEGFASSLPEPLLGLRNSFIDAFYNATGIMISEIS